jgi:hypothetical protein
VGVVPLLVVDEPVAEAVGAVELLTMTGCKPEFHTEKYIGFSPSGDPPKIVSKQ